jgi:hypothetical protein
LVVGGTISPHMMILKTQKNPHDEESVVAQTSPKNNDLSSREKPASLESKCTTLFYTFIIYGYYHSKYTSQT